MIFQINFGAVATRVRLHLGLSSPSPMAGRNHWDVCVFRSNWTSVPLVAGQAAGQGRLNSAMSSHSIKCVWLLIPGLHTGILGLPKKFACDCSLWYVRIESVSWERQDFFVYRLNLVRRYQRLSDLTRSPQEGERLCQHKWRMSRKLVITKVEHEA